MTHDLSQENLTRHKQLQELHKKKSYPSTSHFILVIQSSKRILFVHHQTFL
uniref:Uncharacterized protein n=1 Tax=Arundo donax TaxID=35708 RepID=A0A0A8ZVU2_ARUDO